MLHRLPHDLLHHILELGAQTLPLRHVNRALRATIPPVAMSAHACLSTPSLARWTLTRMRRNWTPHPHTVLAILSHAQVRNVVWAHRPQCFSGRAAHAMLLRAVHDDNRPAMAALLEQELVSADELVDCIGRRGNVNLLLWAMRHAFD